MNPTTLGPKVNGARHGMCDAGPIVMDRAGRDGQLFHARLRIGDAECNLLYASDDDLLTMAWHGWIDIQGEQRRVSIHPTTWVVTFHEAMQRPMKQGQAA